MARAAAAGGSARESATEDWVGIGFRLGTENFVASRSDIREVLPVPDQVTRVPGAKPWLRGITNVRGQLLTVVDLKAFLGSAPAMTNRHARMLMAASRDVPARIRLSAAQTVKSAPNNGKPAVSRKCSGTLRRKWLAGWHTSSCRRRNTPRIAGRFRSFSSPSCSPVWCWCC